MRSADLVHSILKIPDERDQYEERVSIYICLYLKKKFRGLKMALVNNAWYPNLIEQGRYEIKWQLCVIYMSLINIVVFVVRLLEDQKKPRQFKVG